MDSFDRKILEIVQQNNLLSTEKIAEQVNLSPSAVQRRLKRLRKDGIIEADVAIVSPQAGGRILTIIVEVTLEQERLISSVLDEFKKLVLATPEVMQCYHITGNADFILIIAAKDMQDYEALTHRLFIDNRSVRRFQTSLVINKIKSISVIPMLDESS
jgi:Lrp/AsnC family transcriptional regulator, leucine-responsive regulatory protein